MTDRLRDSSSTVACAFVIRNERGGRPLSSKELANLAESFDESVRVTEGTGGSAANKARNSTFVCTNRWSGNQICKTSNRECFVCSSPLHFARECANISARQRGSTILVQAEVPENGLVAGVASIGLNCELARSHGEVNHVKTPGLESVALGSGEGEFTGYLDSGAKISVVRKSVVAKHDSTGATIRPTCAFWDQIVAELAYVPL